MEDDFLRKITDGINNSVKADVLNMNADIAVALLDIAMRYNKKPEEVVGMFLETYTFLKTGAQR